MVKVMDPPEQMAESNSENMTFTGAGALCTDNAVALWAMHPSASVTTKVTVVPDASPPSMGERVKVWPPLVTSVLKSSDASNSHAKSNPPLGLSSTSAARSKSPLSHNTTSAGKAAISGLSWTTTSRIQLFSQVSKPKSETAVSPNEVGKFTGSFWAWSGPISLHGMVHNTSPMSLLNSS